MKTSSTHHARVCFLDGNTANARNKRAPYAVLPVPYERTVSFGRGTARAPAAILKASRHIEA
ncbi:MAG: arginase family protein, partial [Lentisphaerae bacterium]|nr:arginase family protein [Lentisphaerota bacterium]